MRRHALPLSLLLAGGLILPYTQIVAQTTASVQTRLAAQNALFEEYYQNRLKESPLLATNLGEVAREQTENDAFLVRLKAISTDRFVEQDRLSHDLLLRVLNDDLAYRDLKSYEMPGDALGNAVGCMLPWPICHSRCPLTALSTMRTTSPGFTRSRWRWLRRKRGCAWG